MPPFLKNLPHEILDVTESYPLDQALERYNELTNKDDPDAIPVLIVNMSDLLAKSPTMN